MTTTVVEIQDVTKHFVVEQPLHKQLLTLFKTCKKICALDKVSFCIESGNILGVIGANGAGKTTLLRILADLLEPDSGRINLCGCLLGKDSRQLRSKIGYVSDDERSFFWRLTGRENLEFFGRLYGLSPRQVKKRTSELLTQFGFLEKADRLFRDYSSGMRKKISVMRALLNKPTVLLLDEVTNSLDPASAKMVKTHVREYISETSDCCAVWSTHRLEEISQICDKVVMIDFGKIVSGGLVEDFAGSSATEYLLKLQSLDGQFEAFCQEIACKTKTQISKGNTNEVIISGINQQQFSQIVSMAVKDFGAYIIFAGCIKKDPDTIFGEIQSGERFCGNCS